MNARILTICLGFLAWACSSATYAEDRAAWISLSSADQAAYPAGNFIGSKEVHSWRAWAEATVPRFKEHDINVVVEHNPGGQHPTVAAFGDDRPMRIDQWQIGERRRYPWADREDYRAHLAVLDRNGIDKVIVYLGSFTQLTDPVKELPELLKPFTAYDDDRRPGKPVLVHFAFDALLENGHGEKWEDLWATGSPYRTALANLRKRGHEVYSEARPWPHHMKANLDDLTDGSIADAKLDRDRKPELTKQFGKKWRVTDEKTWDQHKQYAGWPETEKDDWKGVLPVFKTKLNWGPFMDHPEAKK